MRGTGVLGGTQRRGTVSNSNSNNDLKRLILLEKLKKMASPTMGERLDDIETDIGRDTDRQRLGAELNTTQAIADSFPQLPLQSAVPAFRPEREKLDPGSIGGRLFGPRLRDFDRRKRIEASRPSLKDSTAAFKAQTDAYKAIMDSRKRIEAKKPGFKDSTAAFKAQIDAYKAIMGNQDTKMQPEASALISPQGRVLASARPRTAQPGVFESRIATAEKRVADSKKARAKTSDIIADTALKTYNLRQLRLTGYKSKKDAVETGLKVVNSVQKYLRLGLDERRFGFLKKKTQDELKMDWLEYLSSENAKGVKKDRDMLSEQMRFLEFMEKKRVNERKFGLDEKKFIFSKDKTTPERGSKSIAAVRKGSVRKGSVRKPKQITLVAARKGKALYLEKLRNITKKRGVLITPEIAKDYPWLASSVGQMSYNPQATEAVKESWQDLVDMYEARIKEFTSGRKGLKPLESISSRRKNPSMGYTPDNAGKMSDEELMNILGN